MLLYLLGISSSLWIQPLNKTGMINDYCKISWMKKQLINCWSRFAEALIMSIRGGQDLLWKPSTILPASRRGREWCQLCDLNWGCRHGQLGQDGATLRPWQLKKFLQHLLYILMLLPNRFVRRTTPIIVSLCVYSRHWQDIWLTG